MTNLAEKMFKVPEREIISPEGVEERVMLEVIHRVTLTGGGKYRTYIISGEIEPTKIYDSLEQAAKALAESMIVTGALAIDVERTLKHILGDRDAKRI